MLHIIHKMLLRAQHWMRIKWCGCGPKQVSHERRYFTYNYFVSLFLKLSRTFGYLSVHARAGYFLPCKFTRWLVKSRHTTTQFVTFPDIVTWWWGHCPRDCYCTAVSCDCVLTSKTLQNPRHHLQEEQMCAKGIIWKEWIADLSARTLLCR